LARRFARCEQSPGLTTALRGERVFGMDAIHHPEKANAPVGVTGIPFANDNLVFYLEFVNQAIEASQRPFPEALDESAKLSEAFRARIGQGGLQKVRYQVAAMVIPAFDAAFLASARDSACSRIVQTLIAVERFQRREGRFPNDLTELVPAYLTSIPVDPSDGKPLRFVASESECKVYSIGRNRVDDGGQSADQLDDVLTLKRRPAR
jgi:hypothetical protein